MIVGWPPFTLVFSMPTCKHLVISPTNAGNIVIRSPSNHHLAEHHYKLINKSVAFVRQGSAYFLRDRTDRLGLRTRLINIADSDGPPPPASCNGSDGPLAFVDSRASDGGPAVQAGLSKPTKRNSVGQPLFNFHDKVLAASEYRTPRLQV